jgi:hypothetical protein
MARKWLIGGLAVGVGALVAVPDARTWLRRRLGLEPEDRRWFEEEGVDAPEYEGDEPLDTREARFSLRARLSEDGPAEPAEAAAPAPFEAPAPEPEPFTAAAPPEPEPEPFAPPAAAEPAPFGSLTTPEPYAPRAAPEPQADPEPEPEPARWPSAEPAHSPEPESTPFTPPARDTGYAPYENVPSIVPEADAPKTPGEDTDEVGPLPPVSSWEPPVAPPPPPPTELRPPPAPPSRPFSSEGSASFRSAIDAARERVHGAAREATPDEADDSEKSDESA